MQWRWIEGGTAMLVVGLGTWPDIVGIRGEESELEIVEDWNMDRNGREREIMDNQTI